MLLDSFCFPMGQTVARPCRPVALASVAELADVLIHSAPSSPSALSAGLVTLTWEIRVALEKPSTEELNIFLLRLLRWFSFKLARALLSN